MLLSLTDLWLPILLSTVAVFFVSFLMWMVLPHHKSDWRAAGNEDALMAAVREHQGSGVRQISFPHCSDPAQMKDPAWNEKYTAGPKGFLILMPEGPVNIGASMARSTIYNLVCTVLIAYVATLALAPGAGSTEVLRLVTTVAFLTFGGALGWGAIWFGRTWSSTFKEWLDALVYGLVTGGIFAALWPAAEGLPTAG